MYAICHCVHICAYVKCEYVEHNMGFELYVDDDVSIFANLLRNSVKHNMQPFPQI